MSRYLIDRIAATPNIELMTETEIVALERRGRRQSRERAVARPSRRQGDRSCDPQRLSVRRRRSATEWLQGCVALDKAGFVITGVGGGERAPPRRRLNRPCPACSRSATCGRGRSSGSAARSAKAPRSWPRSISSSRTLQVPTSNRPSAARMSKTCTHLDDHSRRDAERARLRGMPQDRRRLVHLRLCRTCGHVGCCDDSPNKHATKHFHATRHPIIEGYDPPEGWGWCYVDEAMFDLSDRMTPHNGPIPRYY